MLLQGDLQKVFDALYQMGAIDPALQMDWEKEFKSIARDPHSLARVLGIVNSSLGDYQELVEKLQDFEQKDLGHLAMIVGQELAFFHANRVVH